MENAILKQDLYPCFSRFNMLDFKYKPNLFLSHINYAYIEKNLAHKG